MPRGVESRRRKEINRSVYWSWDINPENLDEHIAYAKKGGFDCMLIYYSAFFKETGDISIRETLTTMSIFPREKKTLRKCLTE